MAYVAIADNTAITHFNHVILKYLQIKSVLHDGYNVKAPIQYLKQLHTFKSIYLLPHLNMTIIAYIHSDPSVQFTSVAQSRPTLRDPMNRSMPGLPAYHQLSELTQLMSIESVMPSNHLILCRPLLLLPSNFPSIRVFLNESALRIRWPKYWSFSFNISPSNEHPGLISFRMAWLGLLAVQGTLKSLLQHHSSKASIL